MRNLRASEFPERGSRFEKDVNLLQCPTCTVGNQKVTEDQRHGRDTAIDEPNLRLEICIRFVEQIWNGERDCESAPISDFTRLPSRPTYCVAIFRTDAVRYVMSLTLVLGSSALKV
jgi:hypothetical protein